MTAQTAHTIRFADALRVWIKIGLLSFGGPAGQIAIMHRILVDEKRWISEGRFLHALNYCMLLPGPEAQQLATYIGWLLHRTLGGIVAGTLFVLPGVVAIMGLSILYAVFGQVGWVAAAFFGLKAAVLAIVLHAVQRVGTKAIQNRVMLGIAAASFVAIFIFAIPFPIIILAAGAAGMIGGWRHWPAFAIKSGHGGKDSTEPALRDPDHPGWAVQGRLAAIWLTLWLLPVAALHGLLGGAHVYSDIALFFSKMAVVTFGGAYAVLAYVGQEAVSHYHWLSQGEMLDGLGMAETTPGPLIMVLQFVGFLAAYRDPGALSPLTAGVLGGLLATWVTFVPCFLWIFLGAPYVEKLRGNRALAAGLASITAAVVGVILNLALWFALHTLFSSLASQTFAGGIITMDIPIWSSLNPWALGLSVLAALALFRWKAGIITILTGCSLAGMVLHLLGVFA